MNDIKTHALKTASRWAIAAGIGFAIAIASPALAADAADARSDAVEEVVVTALRRDEKIQDAPAAVTALTAQNLQRMGVKDFNDYYRAVPSLQITTNTASPGQSRISIRGVYAAGDSTVGLYYGDTPITGPNGNTADPGLQTPNLNLFDVQRVEVLRGPQGTLYGAGSVGGTIRVVYEQPDATRYSGQVEVEGATTAHGGESGFVRGAVNIPLLKDKLALRVVGYANDTAGWVDNVKLHDKDINSGTSRGGRAILAYKPTDNFDITGTFIYQKNKIDDNATWYQSLGEKDYRNDTNIKVPFEDEFQLYSGTLNYKTPIGKFTATSSYYRWSMTRNIDVTATQYTGIQSTVASSPLCQRYNNTSTACTPTQLAAYKAYGLSLLPLSYTAPIALQAESHEARLSSDGGGWFDYTVGVFYEKRHDRLDSYVASANPTTGVIYDPLVANGYRLVETDFSQFSQFAEVAVRPLAGLTVTGGLRHYSYDKEVGGQVLENGYIIGSYVGPRTSVKAKESSWVGKVNVAYKFNENFLGYAQWAQGFRPGGANNVPTLSQTLIAYQPDSLDSYEVGLKTSWAGGLYTLNVAAFQIDWKDIQSTLNVQPAFRVVTNAGDARIRGLELEATARPITGLTLNLGVGYIPQAKLISGQTGGTIVVGPQNGLAGDRLPYTAKVTASLSGDYQWRISEGLTGIVRADANYHGASANEFRPTWVNYERLTPFTEVNARVGVEGDDWGAYLYVNNLTAAIGQLTVQSTTVAAPYQSERQLGSIRPRTFGVTLNKRF